MSIKSPLTKSQRFAFFRACSAACQNLGFSSQADREIYRKKVMAEEARKSHLADLNRTTDFERCMARFCKDAGDWQTAAKYASGDAYRMAMMIQICCHQIMQLRGLPDGSDAAQNYLRGILERSQIACGRNDADSSFWMDVSPDSLMVVFQILDTQRRRLLASFDGIDGLRGFDPKIVYQTFPDGHLRMTFNAAMYDEYKTIKVYVQAS